LFLLAISFTPLVKIIGGGMDSGEGLVLYPVVAPALIMPLTFSITAGIAFGFISYPLLKAVEGRFKKVPALISIFAILFVLRYVFLPH